MPEPVVDDEHEFLMRMIRVARRSLAGINGYADLLTLAKSESRRNEYVEAIQADTVRLVSAVNMIVKRLGGTIPPEALAADEKPPA